MTARFVVVDGSESSHCCFRATVVDTAKPLIIRDQHYEGQFEELCECFDLEDAELIARALNALEPQ